MINLKFKYVKKRKIVTKYDNSKFIINWYAQIKLQIFDSVQFYFNLKMKAFSKTAALLDWPNFFISNKLNYKFSIQAF